MDRESTGHCYLAGGGSGKPGLDETKEEVYRGVANS